MFDTIAPRYDLVNRIMTFGLDRRWRAATVASLGLPPTDTVLDVACGTGDLCRELSGAGYRPVGVDLSSGMLEHARTIAPLVHADALQLPLAAAAVDGAVSGFALRNFVALDPLFAELARVVRPGGRIALLDVATPTRPLLRKAACLVLRPRGAADRRSAFRQGRLPVPPKVRGLPARAGRVAAAGRGGRIR